MKHLTRPLLALLAVSLIACGSEHEGQTVRMLLPAGDPAVGREAFVQLQCATCHAVSGVQGLPAPDHGDLGAPDLGSSLAGQGRGQIASSIVAAEHVDSRRVELWSDWTGAQRIWLGPAPLSPPPRDPTPAPARMSDYRSAMSVEQLCDLVAFLEEASR